MASSRLPAAVAAYPPAAGSLPETTAPRVGEGFPHGLQGQVVQYRQQVQRAARVEQVSDVEEQVPPELPVAGLREQLRLDVIGGYHQAQQVHLDRRAHAVRGGGGECRKQYKPNATDRALKLPG